MDTELKYFLEQGPQSVKELARLTGKSTSTIYKNLKGIGGVQERDGPNGKQFFLPVAAPAAPVEEPKAAPAAPAAPKETGKRGRKAAYAGKKLIAVAHDHNPRRPGSHGFNSLAIIIDNPGITTEQYLNKGGRLNDLRWDIAHGNVEAS